MALTVVCIPNSKNLFWVAAGKEFRYELHNRREYKSVYTSATHDNFKRKSDYLCAFLVLQNYEEKFLENVNQAWLVCLECRQRIASNIR
jgi:hypothetical protein